MRNLFNLEFDDSDDEDTPPPPRPTRLRDFIGLDRYRRTLSAHIKAAKLRNDVHGHILLCATDGWGKATLAGIVAHEMEDDFHATSGLYIQTPEDLEDVLSELVMGDVLLLEDVDALSPQLIKILFGCAADLSPCVSARRCHEGQCVG